MEKSRILIMPNNNNYKMYINNNYKMYNIILIIITL